VEQTKSVKLYRMVLITSIALNVGAGFFIMFWPDAFTNLFNQPEAFPDTWPRHWGWQLLAINALYMPGYWNPIANRWPNYCGIVIRLSFALFFFSQGGGFVMMGVYDGISGLALLFSYLPVLKMRERPQPVAATV
jgi:hypothetical protein